MRSPGKDACVATDGIFADYRKAKLLPMRGHEERASSEAKSEISAVRRKDAPQ